MRGAGDFLVRLSGGLDRLCRLLAKAALVAMVAVITLQIVARYGLRAPPIWTEELARYLMVWGGLLGATLAFRRGADPAIATPDERASGRAALFAKLAIAASVLILVVPILYYSFFGPGFDLGRGFMMRSHARTSPGLGISMSLVAAAIPTFCAIMIVHLGARLVAGPLPSESAADAPDRR